MSFTNYPFYSSTYPGSGTTDIAINKTYPGVQFIGTEASAETVDIREIQGTTWIVTNGVWNGSISGWQQVASGVNSYGFALDPFGNTTRYSTSAGTPTWTPTTWTATGWGLTVGGLASNLYFTNLTVTNAATVGGTLNVGSTISTPSTISGGGGGLFGSSVFVTGNLYATGSVNVNTGPAYFNCPVYSSTGGTAQNGLLPPFFTTGGVSVSAGFHGVVGSFSVSTSGSTQIPFSGAAAFSSFSVVNLWDTTIASGIPTVSSYNTTGFTFTAVTGHGYVFTALGY